MNQQELKQAYAELYGYMANSQDPENMKAFGKVMTKMYGWFVDNKPDKAQEWLEELDAIRWHNYLTPKEAEAIVAKMEPKAPWSREVWRNAMQSLRLKTEDEPCYNSCALWVAMNMIYTDHAETIAENVLNKRLADVPTEQIVTGVHALALDLLCDKDGVFNIRTYFGL